MRSVPDEEDLFLTLTARLVSLTEFFMQEENVPNEFKSMTKRGEAGARAPITPFDAFRAKGEEKEEGDKEE
ncbi:hypothetical protein J6590_098150 [Homalodisca vitripennis]|nr:hypothetical protein J6590_058468 [Homalodisca vitripennis]KAG8314194.1 hypothetical protein J6590_098150 [Homalodisca vitripennis]